MEGYSKRNTRHREPGFFYQCNTGLAFTLVFLIALFLNAPQIFAADEGKGRTIAVLPFRIHTVTPLEHLKYGLQDMLINRLEKRGFPVVSPELILKHPEAALELSDNKSIAKTGRDLRADWVAFVSLTQIGQNASLDLKLIDVSEKRQPFLYFLVAENAEILDESMDRLALSIDNSITGIVQIDSVKVQGNQRIEKEAILAAVQTRKGERLDYDLLDKDLRSIFDMGYFIDVQIETDDGPGGKVVIFNVLEKPSIGKIVFKGNKKEDDKNLQKDLGIKLYSILDQNEIIESIKRLREYYHSKAYYNVEIKHNIKELKDNEVLLEYEIAENDKVFITKIEFKGNNQFSDDKLKRIMETSEKGFFTWFSWFTSWGYLDRKKLEYDVHKITSLYHNHGFIKAKVGEPRVAFEKEKGMTVTIEIEEGQQYGVNRVFIEGDLIKPEEELLNKVQIGKEKVFNREIVRKDVLALRDLYVDEGHAYADVSPGTHADDETRLVDITYRVMKGPKVRFERINISGNNVTRDKVIRRELKVVEGEDFSGEGLRRSSSRIHRLGFFEDVEIQTKKGSEEDLIVLDIKVTERPTGTFSIGAGYSSQDSVFAMGQITQNNLFGYGQKLQLSAKIGGETKEFDLNFVEPWFLGTPVLFGTNLYN
ncbi:MAG TPA: outer membrane protein assembly factor BamA, partial [Desulfobacteraceae bacterium]|nr:outer membrane protein assembly factor BamA [Desulfobacteraceae bacterium]